MTQVAKTLPHGRQEPFYLIVDTMHGCCWTGDERSLGISSQGIELIIRRYPGITRQILLVVWIWCNLIQSNWRSQYTWCWYTIAFFVYFVPRRLMFLQDGKMWTRERMRERDREREGGGRWDAAQMLKTRAYFRNKFLSCDLKFKWRIGVSWYTTYITVT